MNTELTQEARRAISFLRSCARSGEQLSVRDEAWIDATMARLTGIAYAPAPERHMLDGTPCWCVSLDVPHEGWVHAPVCLERRALVLPQAVLDGRCPVAASRCERDAGHTETEGPWTGDGHFTAYAPGDLWGWTVAAPVEP